MLGMDFALLGLFLFFSWICLASAWHGITFSRSWNGFTSILVWIKCSYKAVLTIKSKKPTPLHDRYYLNEVTLKGGEIP